MNVKYENVNVRPKYEKVQYIRFINKSHNKIAQRGEGAVKWCFYRVRRSLTFLDLRIVLFNLTEFYYVSLNFEAEALTSLFVSSHRVHIRPELRSSITFSHCNDECYKDQTSQYSAKIPLPP